MSKSLYPMRRLGRIARLHRANASKALEWTKLTEFHWRLKIGDKLLDYWPTSGKVRWLSRTLHSRSVDEVERFAQGLMRDVK